MLPYTIAIKYKPKVVWIIIFNLFLTLRIVENLLRLFAWIFSGFACYLVDIHHQLLLKVFWFTSELLWLCGFSFDINEIFN